MRHLLPVIVMLVSISVSHANDGYIYPIGLASGSQYQILFVTSGTRDASSSNIADYNAFVTSAAGLNSSLPQGVTWNAVASTSSIAATSNAPAYAGVPVYNTDGQLVVPGTRSLYASQLNAFSLDDQYGTPVSGFTQVWTGSTYTGQPGGINDLPPYIFALGTNSSEGNGNAGLLATFGQPRGNWLESSGEAPAASLPLYALSSPITAVPEPALLPLVSFVAFLLLGRKRHLNTLSNQ